MFNNSKSAEVFDPRKTKEEINIIGCGAVGAAVAELVTRLGVPKLHIWDMDYVEAHNLGNQFYRDKDIGKKKTEALSEILREINPEIEIIEHGAVAKENKLSGYIFMCVDNIDLRRELCTKWKVNPKITMIIDGRMRVTDGVIYAAEWCDLKEKNNLIASMQYTHEEVVKETPVSACGMTLSVIYAPRVLAALMVANMVRFITKGKYNRYIMVDTMKPFLEAFEV